MHMQKYEMIGKIVWGIFHVEGRRMIVVPLEGANWRLWYHFGCQSIADFLRGKYLLGNHLSVVQGACINSPLQWQRG